MLGPAFFDGEDSFSYDVSGGVVSSPEALRNPEVGFVVVPVEARLLTTLSDLSVFFWLSVVMPVGSCICVEDVQRILTVVETKARRTHKDKIKKDKD